MPDPVYLTLSDPSVALLPPPGRGNRHLLQHVANAAHILRGLAEAREGTTQPTGPEELADRFNVQADG